ncbi:MAG: DnaJ domain-containing protein [Alphaproteobacteria bacterium]|nr:DnaJ domain-containing protein [Alphaproteobacteria bacterium]MBL7100063.1 DnaJ domain-containing protein [Alphaproteobacteria bacterium]
MGEILLGIVALVLLIFLLRGFVGASPKALVTVLRYAGAVGLAGVAIALFLTERPAAGAFVASMAWGFFTRGHLWPGGWPHYGSLGRRWSTGSSTSGQTSNVRTAWLEMELDHESGEMNGTILQGAHNGGRLTDLDHDTLISFYEEADDAETRRLLEAYLERRFGPDWRPKEKHKEEPPPRGATGMTRREALSVLGLEEGATDEQIRAAHRRLMQQYHPDKGGSDYLASKINEAKDFLLGD